MAHGGTVQIVVAARFFAFVGAITRANPLWRSYPHPRYGTSGEAVILACFSFRKISEKSFEINPEFCCNMMFDGSDSKAIMFTVMGVNGIHDVPTRFTLYILRLYH